LKFYPLNSSDCKPSFIGHIKIARIDHWVKNVFIIPGIISAYALDPKISYENNILKIIIGVMSVCIVSSSNYTINEIVDAPYDLYHPTKKFRPVPSGVVNIKLAYLQWLSLGIIGVLMGFYISNRFAFVMILLWFMGCIYNIKPIRSKDIPYVDIITEAINNPIRMLAGWYIVSNIKVPPASLILSYWMIGSYFMAIKRYAEFRNIGNINTVRNYRKSLAYFSERKLLVAIIFFGSSSMLFLGAFIMRYRIELIATVPLISLVMAIYFNISFEEDSAAQNPEKLYRQPILLVVTIICAISIIILMFIDIPYIRTLFNPTVPVE
jgi:decaprenyl-phosphate phosphoribosyltransferase